MAEYKIPELTTLETLYGWIETTRDVYAVVEATRQGILGRVMNRLKDSDRALIRSGSIFVWDQAESGIIRWTDGRLWSASRVEGSTGFLVYQEAPKISEAGDKFDFEAFEKNRLRKKVTSVVAKDGKRFHLSFYYKVDDTEILKQMMEETRIKSVIVSDGAYIHKSPLHARRKGGKMEMNQDTDSVKKSDSEEEYSPPKSESRDYFSKSPETFSVEHGLELPSISRPRSISFGQQCCYCSTSLRSHQSYEPYPEPPYSRDRIKSRTYETSPPIDYDIRINEFSTADDGYNKDQGYFSAPRRFRSNDDTRKFRGQVPSQFYTQNLWKNQVPRIPPRLDTNFNHSWEGRRKSHASDTPIPPFSPNFPPRIATAPNTPTNLEPSNDSLLRSSHSGPLAVRPERPERSERPERPEPSYPGKHAFDRATLGKLDYEARPTVV